MKIATEESLIDTGPDQSRVSHLRIILIVAASLSVAWGIRLSFPALDGMRPWDMLGGLACLVAALVGCWPARSGKARRTHGAVIFAFALAAAILAGPMTSIFVVLVGGIGLGAVMVGFFDPGTMSAGELMGGLLALLIAAAAFLPIYLNGWVAAHAIALFSTRD